MRHPLQLPFRSRLLNRIISRVIGLRPLIHIYDSWLESKRNDALPVGGQLLDHALTLLQASIVWRDKSTWESIPQDGPLIVVANHPLGGLEGMLMARELLRRRSDTKVLTNELLSRFPEFDDLFIGLDVLGGKAASRNTRGIRDACKHLAAGGALLIFPAGTVASIRLARLRIEDGQWNKLVGWLARRYHTACMPVHLDARNTPGFYLAGMVHKRLRTLLLPRELANKKNFVVNAAAGELLTSREIAQLGDGASITSFLRLSTDMLAPKSGDQPDVGENRREVAIAPNIAKIELQAQLEKLEPYRLVDAGIYAVYCAPYDALGCLMGQIAIDRETTFRAVDEGTGRELDSDNFDPYYWHLWVWHKQNCEIVGAYRVGKTDEILRDHGIDGLYSRSLYQFDESFIGQIGGAIEVGRSFVTLPYQRLPKALDLLWRGIGAFMVKNPSYHTLFGPVSISRQYSTLARAFLADAMMTNFSVRPEWRQSVRPQSPLHVRGKVWTPEILASLGNVAVINKLLGNLDQGKRIPILLRHYLALNGRFASFTVNKGFNDSLDGLILVDLREAPDKYLNRYLGKEGRRSFLHRWNEKSRAA